MSNHTPGPWVYEPGESVIYGANDDSVASISNAHINSAEANARLISAAPDLLDVAKRVGAWIGGNLDRDLMSPQTRDIYDAAAVAIAKAEGRHR